MSAPSEERLEEAFIALETSPGNIEAARLIAKAEDISALSQRLETLYRRVTDRELLMILAQPLARDWLRTRQWNKFEVALGTWTHGVYLGTALESLVGDEHDLSPLFSVLARTAPSLIQEVIVRHPVHLASAVEAVSRWATEITPLFVDAATHNQDLEPALTSLQASLQGPNWVREQATRALTLFWARRANWTAIESLLRNMDVAAACAHTLELLPEDWSPLVPALEANAQSTDPVVRESAQKALEKRR